MDAGHFIHGCLDYDEQNIHPQCSYCNRHLHGNSADYSHALIQKYGDGIIQELYKCRQAELESPPDRLWIKEKIAYYTQLVKDLNANKSK